MARRDEGPWDSSVPSGNDAVKDYVQSKRDRTDPTTRIMSAIRSAPWNEGANPVMQLTASQNIGCLLTETFAARIPDR
jgi:hypothetical protein